MHQVLYASYCTALYKPALAWLVTLLCSLTNLFYITKYTPVYVCRCLEHKALSLVLSYVGKSPSSTLVCKYWKVCVDELTQPPKSDNTASTEIRLKA